MYFLSEDCIYNNFEVNIVQRIFKNAIQEIRSS